ncbi:MAG: triose-phosphate isomerase [Candidatus Hodarchaeaceae archaeon]|nr:triose-phosphate isomerase [Candidatus Hodarchaeaceae archaeon]
MLETPLVIVNFKTYASATGERAVELARLIVEVASEKGISVAIAPQHADIHRVASVVDIPVLAQHVDPISPGGHTGWILPEAAKEAGAIGALVNHSEHRLRLFDIEQIIKRVKELGMVSIVCADNVSISKSVAALGPDMIAVEPPELIGSGISVSKVKPDVVRNTVEEVHKVNPDVRVLCGAGISVGEDVSVALQLGAEGVIIASGVVQAKDQRAAMLDIAEGVLTASGTSFGWYGLRRERQ